MKLKFKPGLLIDKDPARLRRSFIANPTGAVIQVPPRIETRFEMLPSSDQADSPYCAAYAVAGCVERWRWKELGIKEQIDPNPIYKRAKEIDGAPKEEGTTLEAVVQATVDLNLMPLDMTSLQRVYQTDFQRALHKHGVVLAGFNITESWGKARPDGWIPDEGGIAIGGHAVVLVGYDIAEDWVALQNSWGDSSGWYGFCRMKLRQFANEYMYGLVWETT